MSNNTALNTSSLEVEIKIGILNTISKQIYSDSKVKIREAVANSMDNNATWFIIYADIPSQTLSLIDNGNGITRSKFEDIFKNMGYGTQRMDRYSNSYFGLGLMSIVELGQIATIITKSKDEWNLLKLKIDSEKIFSGEMQNKPLSEIRDCLPLTASDLAEREKLSLLSNDEIKAIVGNFPDSFTEIILENIDRKIFDKIISKEFKDELCQILPISIGNNATLFQSIKDPTAVKWIKDIMNNKEFCPTIDVYFAKSNGDKQLSKLQKYYPEFKYDLEFRKADIDYGIIEDGNDKFAYYYIYSIEDLEVMEKKSTETGFWVRNKNFLVKKADYFQKPGTKQKIIHEPLKNWLFGEIFHTEMTDFLIVTRDEYLWESKRFITFYNKLRDILYKLNKELRASWKNSREITNSIIEPFIFKAGDKNDPYINIDKTLSEIGIIAKPEDTKDVLEKLNNCRKKELEDEEKSIDKIINKNKQNITLADDEQIKVIIDHSVEKDYIKQREEETNRVIVRISPQIFSSKKVAFLGKTFEVIYVAFEENDPGVSVDSENYKIYVNLFNQDIFKYSVSFIEVYIAIEIADIYSETKGEMKSYLLNLLGAKLTKSDVIPKKYLYSLKDELQRRR